MTEVKLKWAKYKGNAMAIETIKGSFHQHLLTVEQVKGQSNYYKVNFRNIDTSAILVIEEGDTNSSYVSRAIHYCEAQEKGVNCTHVNVLAAVADQLSAPLVKVNLKSKLPEIETFLKQFDGVQWVNLNSQFGLLPLVNEVEDEEENATTTSSTTTSNTPASTPIKPIITPPTTSGPRNWKTGWNAIQQYLDEQGCDVALINRVALRRERISMNVPILDCQSAPKKPKTPYIGPMLARAIRKVLDGYHLILIGGKGCGKDRLISTLAWIFNYPMVIEGANRDISKDTIVGEPAFRNNESTFDLSKIAKTMGHGGLVNFAEINMAHGDVTSIFHPVLDTNSELSTPLGAINIHEDFLFVGSMNVGSGYAGTKPLNDALKDRVAMLRLPSPSDEQLTELFQQEAGLHDKTAIKFLLDVRKGLKELHYDGLGQASDTVRGYIAAAEFFKTYGFTTDMRVEAIEDYIINKIEDVEEYFQARSTIRTVFPLFPETEEEQQYIESLSR